MKKVFDEIEVSDFVVDADPEFGKMCLYNQDDTGLVVTRFKIGGANFEYQEWYSVHSGEVEKIDTMHPGATSDLAVMLDDYIKTVQDEHGIGWDFFKEMNEHIEEIYLCAEIDGSEELPEKEKEKEQEQDRHEFISPAELIALAKSIDVVGEYQNIAQAQEALDSGIEALSEKLALVINGAKVKRLDYLYRIIVSLPLRGDDELFAVMHTEKGFILCAVNLRNEPDEPDAEANERYSNIISSYFEYLSK